MLTLPEGMTLSQLRAEHPQTTYPMFVSQLLQEICRCMGIPKIIGLATAENSNYSSARHDLQQFFHEFTAIRCDLIDRNVLDRLLEHWLDEALLISGFIPQEFIDALRSGELEWSWIWQGKPSIDRAKESSGTETDLRIGLTSLTREYAERGLIFEDELRTRARELTLMRELGVEQQFAGVATQANQSGDASQEEDDQDQQDLDEESQNDEEDIHTDANDV